MNPKEWMANQREYLKKQAPLRAAWINGDEKAGRQLKALVEEMTAKCPPLTGTFYYTEEDVEQARKAGFPDD